MQETQVEALGQEEPLEKGMANPFQYSCLEIPWTEEPGRLQSMGSQRFRHDLSTDNSKQPFMLEYSPLTML